MTKKIHLIALIVSLFILTGCNSNGDKPKIPAAAVEKYLPTVSLIKVQGGFDQSFSVTGDVLAYRSTQITAEQRGKIEKVLVKEGEEVKAGSSLISISSSDVASSYRTAQNNLKNAQIQLESTKLSTDESVRAAEIALETAESNLQNTLRQNLVTKNQAEETLKATEVSLSLKISSAETGVKNAINSVRPAVQVAFTAANKIIGATNAYKDLNLDKQKLLGVAKLGSKREAEDALKKVEQLINQNNDDYESALALSIATEDALEKTLITLNNSATGQNYTQSELSADISTITPQLTPIRNLMNGLRSAQAALESAKQQNESGSQDLIQAKAAYETTLSQLETNETNARRSIESAKSSLENAKRSANLSEASAQSNLSNVYGQYDQARVNQNKLSILAPFSGKIREIKIKAGEEINPGTPLIVLEDGSELKIIAYLSSNDAKRVNIGDTAVINAFNESAQINSISSSPDPLTKKYKLELKHVSEKIRPGALIHLTFNNNNEEVVSDQIFIPLTTLHISPEEIFVWTTENNKTVKKVIKIGEIVGNFVEVKEGLIVGENVIDDGGRLIEEEGVEVKIQ